MDKQDIDGYAKTVFNSLCPYTGEYCSYFACNSCDVEQEERHLLENEEEE